MAHPAAPRRHVRVLTVLLRLVLPLLVAVAGPLAPAPAAAPQLLPFTQSRRQPLLRARYELLIPPGALPPATTSLRITLPPRFDGRVLPESLRLCRMVTRPQVAITRCAAAIPTRLEAAAVGEWRLRPLQPLAPGVLHGLTLVLFNPSLDGLYPLRLWAETDGTAGPPGSPVTPDTPGPAGNAVGTWLLPIETDSD